MPEKKIFSKWVHSPVNSTVPLIEPISKNDIPLVAENILREFPYTEVTSERLAAKLAGKKFFIFKITFEGKLAAFIDFEILQTGVGRIRGVVVIEKHRRKGFAKKLVSFAIERLWNEFHCKKIILTVSKDNHAALRIYASFGFEKAPETERKLGEFDVFDMILVKEPFSAN